jgi:porin
MTPLTSASIAVTLLFAAALPALAQTANGNPVAWTEPDRLTGDWRGARTRLEKIGLSIGGQYVAELTSVATGGVDQDASFRNLLTLDAALDLDAAFDIPGGTLFIQYLSVNAEKGGSLDAGDIQIFTNIESDRSLDVIYELWYEQLLLDRRLRIKLGKIDANSEFDLVNVAGDFAHSSAGFSPTILGFPSYPDPAVSVNLFATLLRTDAAELTLGYGLYDGALGVDAVPTGSRGPSTFLSDDRSDDYVHIVQAELTWDKLRTEGAALKDGRLSLGAWRHTGDFPRFDAGTESGASGFFATAELRLFDPDRLATAHDRPPAAHPNADQLDRDNPPRGLYVFAQYAWADEDVAEVAQHLGGGVVWRGPSAARPHDSLGFYASLADLSDNPAAGFEKNEIALDAYYRFQLTPAVYVQPEAQYIVNPSGDPAIDDALILGVRVGVTF